MELSAENIKFIEQTAEIASNKTIEKVLPIVDNKIETHHQICFAAVRESVSDAVNTAMGKDRTNGQKFTGWALRNWHILGIGFILVWLMWAVERGVMTPAEVNKLIVSRMAHIEPNMIIK